MVPSHEGCPLRNFGARLLVQPSRLEGPAGSMRFLSHSAGCDDGLDSHVMRAQLGGSVRSWQGGAIW